MLMSLSLWDSMTKYRQRVNSPTNDTNVIRGPTKFSIPLSNILGVTIYSTIAHTASDVQGAYKLSEDFVMP
jgi:hypothetical protein